MCHKRLQMNVVFFKLHMIKDVNLPAQYRSGLSNIAQLLVFAHSYATRNSDWDIW